MKVCDLDIWKEFLADCVELLNMPVCMKVSLWYCAL